MLITCKSALNAQIYFVIRNTELPPSCHWEDATHGQALFWQCTAMQAGIKTQLKLNGWQIVVVNILLLFCFDAVY